MTILTIFAVFCSGVFLRLAMIVRKPRPAYPSPLDKVYALQRKQLFDQEREDCDYHDHDWEWPTVPEQENRQPSTALMVLFNPDREWAEYAKSIEYAQFVNYAEEDRLA